MDQVKIIKTLKTTDFGGKYTVSEVLVEAPNGAQTSYFLRGGPPFSIIVPLLDTETFVMVEQYRIAADKISLEFPMGQVEGKDNPEEIARQELLEETGYTAQKMIHLSKFHQSPGWSTQIGHIFVAEDLTAGKAEPEEFEFVQNRLVKISEIDDLIADGTIFGMPTIAALYYYRALYGKNAENVR